MSRGRGSTSPPGPPPWATRLLRVVLPAAWRDAVERDLTDLYEVKKAATGGTRARLWYMREVFSFAVRFAADRLRGLGRTSGHEENGRSGGWRWPRAFADAWIDGRHAWRVLLKTPVITVVSVLSLALGIAASTVAFTLASTFLNRDLGPVTDADGLIAIYTSEGTGRRYDETSFPDYQDIAALDGVFDGVAALRMAGLQPSDGDKRDRLLVELVTGNWFDVWGIRPSLGRTFGPAEAIIGSAEPVLVLSYAAWQERYGGDPGVIGRTIALEGRTFTVIGVGPDGLSGRFLSMDIDGWAPLGIPGGTYHATPRELSDRSDRDYAVFARLQPGSTVPEAESRLNALAESLHDEYPVAWTDGRGEPLTFSVLPARESRLPPDGRAVFIVLALFGHSIAGLILLVACANVGGLLFARSLSRRSELAVRVSLGASRGRLVRMLLAEGAILAATGGLLAVLLSRLAMRYLGQPLPISLPLRFDVSMDARTIVFASGVSVGAALLASLLPALRASRGDLQPALRSAGARGGGRSRGLHRLLVFSQVSIATLFLVVTALAMRSVAATATFSGGLDVDGIAVAWKGLPEEDMSPADARRYFLDLADRLEAEPEVEAVTVSRIAEAYYLMTDMAVATVDAGEGTVTVAYNAITPGYMEMMGMRLLRGRALTDGDAAGAPPVALVNQAFLDRFRPGTSGPGERIQVTGWRVEGTPEPKEPSTLDVVGVVADAAPPGTEARPRIWTSFLQDSPGHATFHARGRSGAAPVVPVLYRVIDPEPDNAMLLPPSPYADLIAEQFVGNRIASILFGAAGAFAALLAIMGVYGMVSFTVGRRFREMAIRQTLGARREETVRYMIADGMRPAAAGATFGLLLAIGLAVLARSALFGVSPVDPVALVVVVLAVAAGAFAASAIPARRLMRIKPMNLLRDD